MSTVLITNKTSEQKLSFKEELFIAMCKDAIHFAINDKEYELKDLTPLFIIEDVILAYPGDDISCTKKVKDLVQSILNDYKITVA